jgi:predicted site-specific integrase-resolvase
MSKTPQIQLRPAAGGRDEKPQRSNSFAQESTRPITQVALYARVSTLNNQDPEMQLAELREYAGRRGWQMVEELTDQGVSGCMESRPALNRLMSCRLPPAV